MTEEAQEPVERRVVQASEILAKIEKGEPVKYDHVIIVGDLDLNNLRLPQKDDKKLVASQIQITESAIKGILDFRNAIFQELIDFSKTELYQEVNFERATFESGAWFSGARFEKDAIFEKVIYTPTTHWTSWLGFRFDGSLFEKGVSFGEATIKFTGDFARVGFFGHADFHEATFRSLSLRGAGILSWIDINELKTNDLNLYGTMFSEPYNQEIVCRKAKNIAAAQGNKDDADYYYFREMVARRTARGIPLAVQYDSDGEEIFETRLAFPRNKRQLVLSLTNAIKERRWSHIGDFIKYNFLEYIFIQKIFGYGVHPYELFGWWLLMVVSFAIVYSIKGGIEQPEAKQWYDYFWFSVATAATPGYALYKPIGWFKFIAGIEAILGTFMWAAFIATFARKFMR